MHIAVVGNPRSWYCRDLERAARQRGHRFSLVEFSQLTGAVARPGGAVRTSGLDLTSVDAVVVRTMPPGSLEQVVFRMDVLARLEREGVPILNPPRTLECAVDKYLAAWKLQAAGLPVPPTIVCENSEAALEAFESLGGDVVVKPMFGSEGRGIVRVSDPDLAVRTFRTLERIQSVLYLQQYIPHRGFDVRVLILDGEVLGSILRRSADDFRTNISRNGSAAPHPLTDQERRWALEASQAVGTRFAGVDLLYDRDGRGYVIEVNAVPGWRGFARVTGGDVAGQILRSMERCRDISPA